MNMYNLKTFCWVQKTPGVHIHCVGFFEFLTFHLDMLFRLFLSFLLFTFKLIASVLSC